jgi:hypothetical protein
MKRRPGEGGTRGETGSAAEKFYEILTVTGNN